MLLKQSYLHGSYRCMYVGIQNCPQLELTFLHVKKSTRNMWILQICIESEQIYYANQSDNANECISAYIPSFSFTKRNYKAISLMYFAI